MRSLASYLPDFDAEPAAAPDATGAAGATGARSTADHAGAMSEGRAAMNHLRVVPPCREDADRPGPGSADSPFPDFAGQPTRETTAPEEADGTGETGAGPRHEKDLAETGRPAPETPAPPDPIEAARQAAIAETRASLEAEQAQAIEAAREEEREKAATEREAALEAARARWAHEEGERLATRLDAQLERFETVVRTSVAAILGPLARDARQRKTLEDLADAVERLTHGGAAVGLTVRGPSDLVEPLLRACGARAALLTSEIDDEAVEVTLTSDQTHLETRLSEWKASLREALA